MATPDGAKPRRHGAPAVALIACAVLGACASSAPVGTPAPQLPAPPPRAASQPPAATSVAQTIPLKNPGFESDKPGAGGTAEGWAASQHVGVKAYTFIVDRTTKHTGEASLRIRNTRPEVYGNITQSIPAAPLVGKTLRFSVWLRSEDVVANDFGKGATPLLQAWAGGSPAVSASYEVAAIAGTTDWVRRQVSIEVAGAAEWIEIGVMLTGSGTVWLDDAVLEVVASR